MVDFMSLRSHDEIVLMQTTNLMCPPVEVQIARNHKHLVNSPSINFVVARNHKIRLVSLAGWMW